ncbi:MAG: heme-binding protein [Levilactobacillus sp.]|uniref:Heme-binding protein n=1 Tax=Levilactobacillus suantsaiihabitans TaxID=2487722 RepID=A0A4Z0JDJ9_9LACO|nr:MULTISPECIES: heme-binding protein [Levilactobacillus]MCI1553211.1 heme-binding protein [Levilactobacillus sp.]TGD20353.1 heme-binding protein [Levilactobacillus suantsaiihabitans]
MNEEQLKHVVKSVIEKQQTSYFSLDRMERVIHSAVQTAKSFGIGVTIVIMREDQVVQMSYHMPSANLVSSTLAPKKAWSALAMKQPTIQLSKLVQPGAELYQIETMMGGQLATFGGGIPLEVDGHIIGAIGVSGGAVAEDQAICEAAVNAFMKESD